MPPTINSDFSTSRAQKTDLKLFLRMPPCLAGRSEKLVDITSAATLPDAETRMAALGVWAASNVRQAWQSCPSCMIDHRCAFAAGALGIRVPGGVAPLTHAIGTRWRWFAAWRCQSRARLRKTGPCCQRSPEIESSCNASAAKDDSPRHTSAIAGNRAGSAFRPSIRGAAAQA